MTSVAQTRIVQKLTDLYFEYPSPNHFFLFCDHFNQKQSGCSQTKSKTTYTKIRSAQKIPKAILSLRPFNVIGEFANKKNGTDDLPVVHLASSSAYIEDNSLASLRWTQHNDITNILNSIQLI